MNFSRCSTKRLKAGNSKPIYLQVDWSNPPRFKIAYPAKYSGTEMAEYFDRITSRVNALLRVSAKALPMGEGR